MRVHAFKCHVMSRFVMQFLKEKNIKFDLLSNLNAEHWYTFSFCLNTQILPCMSFRVVAAAV